jgi:6-phosphogluconolactonase (cycloisomerase 2 family)
MYPYWKNLLLVVALFLVVRPITLFAEGRGVVGAVYTMTNADDGNEVLVYDRFANGSIRFFAAYPTGGDGSGGGLGNQGGVVLSANGRWLLVVNAGSHEVSVFSVQRDGLTLVDKASSGGMQPVSVAIHQNLVYVVHAASDSIAGLRLGADGMLSPLAGSSRQLSGANTAPAQIGFSPDGRFLLVTEKATNLIDVFPLDRDGYAADRIENASAGITPFAFDFGRRDQVFVSEVFGGEEDAGAVSSYSLGEDGQLLVIDGSVPNTETAPCWLVVTKGGRYVYTTNTPDDSLSAYSIDFDGRIALVDSGGRTGEPGPGTRPLDMDLSDDGRFLYTLNIGNNTISTFRVMRNGALKHVQAEGGVPAGVNGLAAR